ncbi:MAG TPA: head GIN domain-containing protein [Telluria sp.]|nr:head GIN domain-containing protein [Telluria sp.]
MKTTFTTRRSLLAAACTLAFAAPFGLAHADTVSGSGNVQKQARQVGHFTGVALSLPGTVELHVGNTESVTVETDDNLLPLVETVVEDGTLKLRTSRRDTNLRTRNLKIVVTARAVERLSLAGSGSIESDPLRGSRLEFTIGGSGALNVKSVEAENVAVKLGGSGDLRVGGGNARNLSVSIGGSGNVEMGKVKIGSASVRVAGSGNATVWVQDSLDATVAGSGDVNYYGDPRVSQSVVGSGGARRMGPAPK